MVGDISAEARLFIRMAGVQPDEIEIEEYREQRGQRIGQMDGAGDVSEQRDLKGKGKAVERDVESPDGIRGCAGLMRRDSLELAASRMKRMEKGGRRVGSMGGERLSRLESRAGADGMQRRKSVKIRDPFEQLVELQRKLYQVERAQAAAQKEKSDAEDQDKGQATTEDDKARPKSRRSALKESKCWQRLTKRHHKRNPPTERQVQSKRKPPVLFRIEAVISTRILGHPAFEHRRDAVSLEWLHNAYARVEAEQVRRFSASTFPPHSPKHLRFVFPNTRPEDRHYPCVHSENYRPSTPHPAHRSPPQRIDNLQLTRQPRLRKGAWVPMEHTPLTGLQERKEVREEGGRVLVDHYLFGEPTEEREEYEERVYGEGEWGEGRVRAEFGI